MTTHTSTRSPRKLLPATLALLLLAPALAAGAPRRGETADICVSSVSPVNTLVFKDVASLAPGGSTLLHGFYFTSARRASAFSGSAVMASDGSVRMGIFVHSSATPSTAGTFLNDFTLSGITGATLAGELKVDNDGDFVPNGTLTVQAVDCSSIVIP